jgi:hypothetical protein
MGYIDADAHVIECEETWDYLDPSERQYRPVAVEVPSTVGGKEPIRLYLIGETFCRRFPTDCRSPVGGTGYSSEISHLENPAARLRDMDAVGIDVQVSSPPTSSPPRWPTRWSRRRLPAAGTAGSPTAPPMARIACAGR